MPSSVLNRLDRWHAQVTAFSVAGRFTLTCRLLLAAAFIPTGLVKLLGQRFTVLGLDTPTGFFFEAMYRAGLYWRFLGLSQLVAGLLLLVPRTAFAGALLFLPIVVNIAIITTAIEFEGTPVVTWAMCLATLWLLAWDWPRWRPVLVAPAARPLLPDSAAVERVAWGIGATALFALLFSTRFPAPRLTVPVTLTAGALAAGTILVSMLRRPRAGRADASARTHPAEPTGSSAPSAPTAHTAPTDR